MDLGMCILAVMKTCGEESFCEWSIPLSYSLRRENKRLREENGGVVMPLTRARMSRVPSFAAAKSLAKPENMLRHRGLRQPHSTALLGSGGSVRTPVGPR